MKYFPFYVVKDQAVKLLQNMPFPSVKGGYKFFLDLLDQVILGPSKYVIPII